MPESSNITALIGDLRLAHIRLNSHKARVILATRQRLLKKARELKWSKKKIEQVKWSGIPAPVGDLDESPFRQQLAKAYVKLAAIAQKRGIDISGLTAVAAGEMDEAVWRKMELELARLENEDGVAHPENPPRLPMTYSPEDARRKLGPKKGATLNRYACKGRCGKKAGEGAAIHPRRRP